MSFHYCEKCGGPECTGEVGCRYGWKLTAEKAEAAKKFNAEYPRTKFARLRAIATAIKQARATEGTNHV